VRGPANRATMRRFDRLLAPHERLQLVSREHGVVLVGPFVQTVAVITAAAALAYGVASLSAADLFRRGAVLVAAGIAAFAFLRLVRAVVRWQTSTLVVTDRRAMLVSGWVAPRVASLRLDSIEDIEISRSPSGRVLHYGRLVISSGGRRGALLGLRRLPDPDLLLALLLGLTARPRLRRSGRTAAAASAALAPTGSD